MPPIAPAPPRSVKLPPLPPTPVLPAAPLPPCTKSASDALAPAVVPPQPVTENCADGDDVPIPTFPVELMTKAGSVDVASAVEVAMYKLLLMARKLHKLFAGLLSVKRSCGAEEVPSVITPKSGVVVPTPTYPPVSMRVELAKVNVVPFHFAR